MSISANYSVPNTSGLRSRANAGLTNNANLIVGRPYPAFSVPPTNHVWMVSAAEELAVNVIATADTTRRWVGMAGTPMIGYQPPSGTPPFIGVIAIDTVAQTIYFSINNAGASSDWINVSGNGAGTAL